jgi:ATP-dependent RNA helicase DDX5/DBP2
MAYSYEERQEPEFGDEVWADDEVVRTIAGQAYEPWKTWDSCCGSWKFPKGLMQFLIDAGFKCPTPIQAHTWPVLMDGKDVVGVAKTGSGKTLGYLLPGYIKVKRAELERNFSCDHRNGPAMLVMAPTRELCQQIYEESDRFGKPAQIATACVYGGAPKQPQVKQLWNGPHCVVATPGRLNDFLKEGSIKIGQCLYLVLDEADRMLDMGFEPQIKELSSYLPEEKQNAFFTATWPREVQQVARMLTYKPTHIQVGSSDATTSNADITQHVVKIRSEGDKMKHLEEVIFPSLQQTGGAALIFTKTKRATADLHKVLSRAGAPIVALHGDMEQRARDNALWSFKTGKAKVLVATDVAQRGLDVKNVQYVVNYDSANNLEDYVHRIGRTGRAGDKGDAYSYLYENETGPAQNILKAMKKVGQQAPQDLLDIVHPQGYGGTNGGWGGKYANTGGGGGGKGKGGKGKGGW